MRKLELVGTVIVVLYACGGSDRSSTPDAGGDDTKVMCVDTLVYGSATSTLVSGDDPVFCQSFVDSLNGQFGSGQVLAPGPNQPATMSCTEAARTFNDKNCSYTVSETCPEFDQRWDCSYRAETAECTLGVNAKTAGIKCEVKVSFENDAGTGGLGGVGTTGGTGGAMGGAGGEGGSGGEAGTAGAPPPPPPICESDGDGVCDEPSDCPLGTDSDCVCQSANDGVCDEPSVCAPGTDYPDCDCPTDQDEPNNTEADATPVTDITDCDSDQTTLAGTIQDTTDVDVYTFAGNDVAGCAVDPRVQADDTSGIDICLYADCGAGGTTVSCVAGIASTSDEGRDGCCAAADGSVSLGVNCSGFSDDATMYVVVSSGSAGVCAPYSVSYVY